jgi:hypothetical protein
VINSWEGIRRRFDATQRSAMGPILDIYHLEVGQLYHSDRNATIFRLAVLGDKERPWGLALSLYLGKIPFSSIEKERREAWLVRFKEHRMREASYLSYSPSLSKRPEPRYLYKFLRGDEISLCHYVAQDNTTYVMDG